MAPTDQRGRSGRVQLEGTLRVSCADFSFRLRFKPGRLIVDFPSLGMLVRARKEAADLQAAVANLPPLPGSPAGGRGAGSPTPPIDLSSTDMWVAVNMRPVGRVVKEPSGMRFRPTPFSFLSRLPA